MPHLNVNGAKIYYEEHGSGSETIVFSHGLLWSGHMFHNQIEVLKGSYRCITFDHRGQGQSEVTPSGYDVDSLYDDALAVMATLDCVPCHFVGLSMGGFVGLRVAIRRRDMLKSLILMETSADAEPEENIGRYRLLGFVARWIGMRLVADRVMTIMFGHDFLHDPERAHLRQEWRERLLSNDRVGITRALGGVTKRAGVTDELGQIEAPTLIIVGDQDVATVPAKAERMHARIPNSRLVVIPGAGHTSTVEEPEAVTHAIVEFLDQQAE